MGVTPIGWVLLVVSPLFMLIRPLWLYLCFLFFLPFTATGIANVGSGQEGSAVQVAMFLGALLILRCMATYLAKRRLPLPRLGRSPFFWLVLFTFSTVVSLVMPILIDGRVLIPSELLEDPSSHPLYLSSHNVTGVLYMLYGLLVVYITAVLNRNSKMMRMTIKAFLSGSVFSAMWAIVEFFCKITGIEYPAFLFNTGTAGSTMGYKQVISGGTFRLSSVAVEPSIFAQALLVAIVLFLPYLSGRNRLFGRKADRLMVGLLLVVLLLTTSSTAYVGLAFGGFVLVALLASRGMLRFVYLGWAVGVLTLLVSIYVGIPVVRNVIEAMLLSKSGTYSALERLMTIQHSWELFKQYPALGIGWESIVSHDLIVHILSGAGVIGMLLFSMAIIQLFRALYRSIHAREVSVRTSLEEFMRMDVALYVAFAITIFTSMISGFLNVFSFFWFVWGLAIAVLDLDLVAVPEARRGAVPTLGGIYIEGGSAVAREGRA